MTPACDRPGVPNHLVEPCAVGAEHTITDPEAAGRPRGTQ